MYNPSKRVANWFWDDFKMFLQACSKFNRAIKLYENIKNGDNSEARETFERYYDGEIEKLEKTIRETDELRRVTLREFNRQCAWAHVPPIPDDQCEKFLESLMDHQRRSYYNGIINKFKDYKVPTVLSVEEIETKYQNICAKRREKLGGANDVR